MKVTLATTQISSLMEKSRLFTTQWSGCNTVSFAVADNKMTMYLADRSINSFIKTSVDVNYQGLPVYFSLNKLMWNTVLGKYNCESSFDIEVTGDNKVKFTAGGKSIDLACSVFSDPEYLEEIFTEVKETAKTTGTKLTITTELLNDLDLIYSLYKENYKYKDTHEPAIKVTNDKVMYMDYLLMGFIHKLSNSTGIASDIRFNMELLPVIKTSIPFRSEYYFTESVNGDSTVYWEDDTTSFIVTCPVMENDDCEAEIEASKPMDQEHGFNVSLGQFSAAMKLFNGFYETEYKEFVIDAKENESLTLHLNSYNVHIDEQVQDAIPEITGKIGVRGPNMETVIDTMLKAGLDDARMYFDEFEARSLGCNVADQYFFIFGTIGDYSSEN